MDVKDLVKLHVVSHMGGSTPKWAPVASLLVASALEDTLKAVPNLIKGIAGHFAGRFARRVRRQAARLGPKPIAEDAIPLNTRHTLNTFAMARQYATDQGNVAQSPDQGSEEMNGMVDAVLSHIAKLHNVPSLNLIDNGQVVVAYKEKPIQVARDIYCKIDHVSQTETGSIASVKLTLLSNTASAAELAAFVKTLYGNYQQEMKNSLGASIYYFDQKSREGTAPPMPVAHTAADVLNHKRMVINTAPKQLSFTMAPFHSNKQFSNIFGDDIRLIEKRVRFFLEHRDWYDAKGVPYQLGILLSGVPGAGKTSVIRAIANLTKRHIVNVNFANITTASQLKNLFYSDKLNVYTDQSLANAHSYFIPIDQRLYVLEEIDATGDIVKQRTNVPQQPEALSLNDELTLAEILTVLDGTMEIPGRITVMTTNHPDVLDRALVRPGRIDLQVHFGHATCQLIAEMFAAYLDRPLSPALLDALPDRDLTPAEVGQVLFSHFDTGDTDETIVEHLRAVAMVRRGALSGGAADEDSLNQSELEA
jgi:hypothetical protein